MTSMQNVQYNCKKYNTGMNTSMYGNTTVKSTIYVCQYNYTIPL